MNIPRPVAGTGGSTILSLLSLTRPRTWVYAGSSLFYAYSIAGDMILWKAILGVGIAFLTTAATNLINAYTDVDEDAINQPIRKILISNVGLNNIKIILAAMYSFVFVASYFVGFTFFLLAPIVIFDSIFYSLPPLRFKAHLFRGMLSFTGAVALAFLWGYSISGNLLQLPLVFVVVSYFFFAYFMLKNIPDRFGDQKVKISHVMTKVKDYKRSVYFSFAVVGSPFALIGGMVTVGLLGLHFLLMFVLIPPLVVLSRLNVRSRDDTVLLERYHTYAFVFGATFLMLAYVLAVPTLESIAAATFFYAFLYLVMRFRIVDSRQPVSVKRPEESLALSEP